MKDINLRDSEQIQKDLLDLIDESHRFTRSDLQGVVQVMGERIAFELIGMDTDTRNQSCEIHELLLRETKLERKITKRNEEIFQKQKDLDTLNNIIPDLEIEINECRDSLSIKDQRIMELENDLENLEGVNKFHVTDKEEYRTIMEQNRKTISEQSARLSYRANQIEELNNQLHEMNEKIAEQSEVIYGYQKSINNNLVHDFPR